MVFRVGDRVRLTGVGWGAICGKEVTIDSVVDGWAFFTNELGIELAVEDDPKQNLGAELVTPGGNHPQDFESRVKKVLGDIADLLIEKNTSYGNSAFDPVRIFSNASPEEQLKVRIDDKLSRIARGSEYPGDDTVKDLIGYLTIFLISKENNA